MKIGEVEKHMPPSKDRKRGSLKEGTSAENQEISHLQDLQMKVDILKATLAEAFIS